MDDENEESSSDVDGSESPDLDDEWRNWRVDDPELESDEAADEGMKKKRSKHWESGEDSNEMSMNLADGVGAEGGCKGLGGRTADERLLRVRGTGWRD